MSTYWSILEKVPGSKLRLTKIDDEIYEHFQKEFPDFDPKATIIEDDMKSKAGKEQWRNFIMQYENKVDDYNFGTMLRASPAMEYGEKETIFGVFGAPKRYAVVLTADHFSITAVRMQFYAVEIARYEQLLCVYCLFH